MSDISDMEEHVFVGGSVFSQGSGFLACDDANNSHASMRFDLANLELWEISNKITVSVRIKIVQKGNGTRYGFGVFMRSTNAQKTYIGLNWEFGSPPAGYINTGFNFFWDNDNDPFASAIWDGDGNFNELAESVTTGQYIWLKMIRETDGTYYAWADKSNLFLEPAIYDTFIGTNTGGNMSDVVQFGVSAINTGGSSQDLILEFDNLNITSDAFTTVIGFDASIEFSSVVLRNALNGGGNGVVKIPNPFANVSMATLLSQQKKLITYLNSFGQQQWQGECGQLTWTPQEASFEIEECTRKMMYAEVGESPVIFPTVLRYSDGLVLTDKDAGFVTRGITQDHLVNFVKADKKIYSSRPKYDEIKVTEADGVTLYAGGSGSAYWQEDGNKAWLYFYDKDQADSVNGINWTQKDIPLEDADNEYYMVHMYNYSYRKYGNTIEKIEVYIKCAWNKTSVWAGNDPRFIFYNQYEGTWDIIDGIGKSQVGSANYASDVGDTNRCAATDFTYDLENTLRNLTTYSEYVSGTTYAKYDRILYEDKLYTSRQAANQGNTPEYLGTWWQLTLLDYVANIDAAGAEDEFNKDRIIFVMQAGRRAVNLNTDFHLYEQKMSVIYVDDNEPEISTATIAVGGVAATAITLDAMSGINLPEEDGFGVDDFVYITKNIEDYIQDAWDGHNIVSDIGALNINITGSTSMAIIEDHTNKTFFDLAQAISDMSNSTFFPKYLTATTRSIELVSADNHISTGLTLTAADIENYEDGGCVIVEDPTKQRNFIRIIGDDVNYIKTITPALDAFDLGDETEIIDDSSIQTTLQAKTKAIALSKRMIPNEVIITLMLNYTSPTQNYSAIAEGMNIALKLPSVADTSVGDWSGNDELTIIAVELEISEGTQSEEHITLMLQRRYS